MLFAEFQQHSIRVNHLYGCDQQTLLHQNQYVQSFTPKINANKVVKKGDLWSEEGWMEWMKSSVMAKQAGRACIKYNLYGSHG